MARLRELLQPLLARWAELKSRTQIYRERALDVWNRLSPRDQQLVAWIGSGLSMLVLVLVVFAASSHLSTLRKQIGTRTKQLAQVRDMHDQYAASKSRLDQLNARLRQSSGPPTTFLEQKAKEANVSSSLDGMRELTAPPNDFFKAQLVEVKLKKVSVANVVRYLHKIESTGVGMTVRSLHLEANFQDPKYLNATIDVLSIKPKEGS